MSVIVVSKLAKRYGILAAVDGISFEVQKGEIFAFLGPNGAGKTTTVEIIECLRAKTSGTVRVLGFDVDRDARRIRERIGVLPQEFNTFDRLTVRENVAYYADLFGSDADVDRLVAAVGLQDKADAWYMNLSGGLKQRTGIAIALVNDPEIVFLDEPTTGLDPHARRQVWALVSELKRQGRTVFLTTHYMEEAQQLADRVGVIHKGRIVAMDRPEALIRAHGGETTVRLPGSAALVPRAKRWLPHAKIEARNGTLVIAPGAHPMDEVISVLSKNAHLAQIEVRNPNLEDAFLALTGEKLGGDEA